MFHWACLWELGVGAASLWTQISAWKSQTMQILRCNNNIGCFIGTGKGIILTSHSSRSSGASWSAPSLPQTTAKKWTYDQGEPPARSIYHLKTELLSYFRQNKVLVQTLLNCAQETIMLLKSPLKSGLSKIFWAKKCWLHLSKWCFVWTSEVNLLFRVLYIIFQGTYSGTANGTLS